MPRAMAAVEKVEEKRNMHVVWPSLGDVRVLDFNPRVALVVAVGEPIFPPGHILPDRIQRAGKPICPPTLLWRGVA
jgi:hypothetical protein